MSESANKTAMKIGNAGNLTTWNAQAHKFPEIEREVSKVKADLETMHGPLPPPLQAMVRAAALANYTGILLVQNRLLAARGRYGKIEGLLGMLPTLTGALQRSMRLLGSKDAGQDDETGVPTVEEYIASRTGSEANR